MQAKRTVTVSWVAQVTAAVIMGQTLFFKFTGAPETVALFTALGMEPFGRIGTGVAELIASVLLLIPATAPLGALLGVGLMIGAVGAHLTVLGINYNGDGGALFAMAIVTLLSSLAVLWLRRDQVLRAVGQLGISSASTTSTASTISPS
ncbi:MAG: DoxX family protein [Myxococcota bacterium]